MLGKGHYYHGIIKKVVIVFGRLFEGLKIHRVNNQTDEVEQVIEVPVSYGPREKWLARLQETPDIDKKTAITLPRIGFELVSMQYEAHRKIQTMNLVRSDNSTTTKEIDAVYAPVPYSLMFQLYIITKTNEDALQIIEQILPFFPPQHTVTMNIVPAIGINQDIPITLSGVNFQDTYDGSFETRREIIYTLTFEVKCNLFGPVERKGTILQTIMNIDPKYGEVSRRARSTATLDELSGNWDILDELFDIDRDPSIY